MSPLRNGDIISVSSQFNFSKFCFQSPLLVIAKNSMSLERHGIPDLRSCTLKILMQANLGSFRGRPALPPLPMDFADARFRLLEGLPVSHKLKGHCPQGAMTCPFL